MLDPMRVRAESDRPTRAITDEMLKADGFLEQERQRLERGTLRTKKRTMHQTASIESPYLTSEEAAAYIRSTVQGIYALVKRGRVKPMPGSGKLLFTREALDRYLTTRRQR